MLPELHIASVRRITDGADHEAFTDLCRFRGAVYLTFRSCPEGHGISSSASVKVLRSSDGVAWREVFEASVPNRDTRDPHLVVFNERLHLYTGTWEATPEGIAKRELNDHLGYLARTEDGDSWSDLEPLESTRGHYIWRAAAWNDRVFLCGRRKHGFAALPDKRSEWAIQESVMLGSDDGVVFSDAGLFQLSYGDETAFVFGENGEVTALARNRNAEQPALLCRSASPWDDWERGYLDRNVGGPMLAWWGNFLIAGGRGYDGEGAPLTRLYWVDGDQLVEAADLPSGGDCSYPGFVEIAKNRALVSYYSSHEGSGDPLYPASIYLAELTID